jgi:GH25 family lysozyme M1 (1,4-beta-N-acetylmuramidase)
MTEAGEKAGAHLGIYASKSQWTSIMCGNAGFSHYPLWYPHYDNNPSFSDFAAFAGWARPAIKQYTGTTAICGTELDNNFY